MKEDENPWSKSDGVLHAGLWLDAKGKRKIEARHERKMKMYRAGFGSQTELSMTTPIFLSYFGRSVEKRNCNFQISENP
jgi:hypothetical protein